MIIVNTVNVITGYKRATILMFLFPVIHNMWFVTAIAILYAVCFAIHKYLNNFRLCFIGAIVVLYIVLYTQAFDISTFFVERHLIFIVLYGFVAMEIGSYIYIYICKKLCTPEMPLRKISKWLFVVAAASIASFLGLKLMINHGLPVALKLQFLTQIFSLSFAISFFIAVSATESKIIPLLEQIKLKRLLLLLGECTLEIYLVQPYIISKLVSLPFPINFILTCTLIFIAGWAVHFVSTKAYGIIIKLLEMRLQKHEGR